MRGLFITGLTLLLAADDRFQEVNRHLLVAWQVDATFHGAELIALAFCGIFCGKGFGGDCVVLRPLAWNLSGVVLLH